MKILFLVGATSRIRNFHHSIRELAAHGHEIQLTGRLRKGAFELPSGMEHERISGRVNPTQRSDAWKDVVDLLRGARDYVRYFDPRYAQATRLVRRAYEIAPTEFVLFCERQPWVKRHWQRVSRALALAEDLIPVDPGFEAFVREEKPDLVVVTPLVTFESYQTDYVKAAHALGVPVVFIPFSWDNLTNKGLMRVQPDRVLVWNDVQRTEAIDLHGVAPDRVAITGAARFDDFFERTPSTSRAEFMAEYGLDAARPMLLYLGSSQLTGPNEMELVRRWAESIRASADPVLRDANILLRPHPALRNSYASIDYSDLERVAMSLGASRGADQDLYDSLFHAHAAIGLNTSAMLEAAIVGRPVHTLVIPGFDEGQLGTMHFHYLVEAYGGLATVARDLPEHHRQLAGVLQGEPAVSPRSRAFAEKFLRPHGIDRPVGPIVTAEIERAFEIQRPAAGAPVWHGPVRRALLGWLTRRRAATSAAVDATIVGTSMSLRPVKTALEEMQQSTAPIFVGPWNDSIANELQLWIPFVRWVLATYGVPPERVIVLSRAGHLDWYAGLGQRSLDIGTLFSPAELEHWANRIVPQSEQDPKQAVIPPFDSEIIERAVRAFELSDHQVLHPALLFRTVNRANSDRAPEKLAEVLHYARPSTPPASSRPQIPGLPKSYVAASLASTPFLQATEGKSLAFLTDALAHLAGRSDVVIVDAAGASDAELPDGPRVHAIARMGAAGVSLELQARVIAHASAFVGGYGDLAVLAASLGTPSVAYHNQRLPDGLPARAKAVEAAGWAPISIERAGKGKIRVPAKATA